MGVRCRPLAHSNRRRVPSGHSGPVVHIVLSCTLFRFFRTFDDPDPLTGATVPSSRGISSHRKSEIGRFHRESGRTTLRRSFPRTRPSRPGRSPRRPWRTARLESATLRAAARVYDCMVAYSQLYGIWCLRRPGCCHHSSFASIRAIFPSLPVHYSTNSAVTRISAPC